MKKLFLAGAALIAVSASIAAKAAVELPSAMLGAWCGHWAWQFPDDGAERWWRADDVEDCANRGGVRVHKDGYDYNRFGPQGSCQFTTIEFRRLGNLRECLAHLV